MKRQTMISNRIKELCRKEEISFYTLSYKSAVPMTTLMHILDGSTKNPGFFTIVKICNGLNVTVKDFFDTPEFEGVEYEEE